MAEDATPEVQTETAPQHGVLVLKRNGAETSERFVLTPPSIIGRFDPTFGPIDVDLGPLPEGSYISRKHAKIVVTDGVWTIHDLGSSNGTFILKGEGADMDFVRETEAELTSGTEFALGNARFVFYLEGAAEPQAEAEAAAPEAAPEHTEAAPEHVEA